MEELSKFCYRIINRQLEFIILFGKQQKFINSYKLHLCGFKEMNSVIKIMKSMSGEKAV